MKFTNFPNYTIKTFFVIIISSHTNFHAEKTAVLTSQVGTNHVPTITELPAASPGGNDPDASEKTPAPSPVNKTITKIFMANAGSVATQSAALGKLMNPSLITVMNTPITVVKTIGSTAPSHFTLVNSTVKSPTTITLMNAPITVVKSISPSEHVKVSGDVSGPATTNNGSVNNGSLAVSDKPVHNVFVKKSLVDGVVQDVPQSHKLLTANAFPTNNVSFCFVRLTLLLY